MAVVRVGVDHGATRPGSPGVEFAQRWVEVNGVRLPDDWLIVRADYEPAPAGESPQKWVAQVVLRLMCEGFSTVDHREPPPSEEQPPRRAILRCGVTEDHGPHDSAPGFDPEGRGVVGFCPGVANGLPLAPEKDWQRLADNIEGVGQDPGPLRPIPDAHCAKRNGHLPHRWRMPAGADYYYCDGVVNGFNG